MSKFSIFSFFVFGVIFSGTNAWPHYDRFEPAVKMFPITGECLKEHNALRAEHGVPDLSYDKELELHALKRAQHMLESKDFEFDVEGENTLGTWLPYGDWSFYSLCKEATDEWYDEIIYYDFSKPGFNPSTQQFTKVVWKDTTKLGCAAAIEKDDAVFIVCNYNQPGNLDHYEENVLHKIHYRGYDSSRGLYDLPMHK